MVEQLGGRQVDGPGVADHVGSDGSTEDEARADPLARGPGLGCGVDGGAEGDDGGPAERGCEPVDGVLALRQALGVDVGYVEAGVSDVAGVDAYEELAIGQVALVGLVADGPGEDHRGHGDVESDGGRGERRARAGLVTGQVAPREHPGSQGALPAPTVSGPRCLRGIRWG